MILKSNPAEDEYHTWIRDVEDIVNIKENANTQLDLTKREARLAALKAATGHDVSTDSISAEKEDVNGYSLKEDGHCMGAVFQARS